MGEGPEGEEIAVTSTPMDDTNDAGAGEGFDETVDVVVVGFGYAGAIAAVEAHDAGATVMLLEKMPNPGGISICSGGGARAAHDADVALRYLKVTCDGRTSEDVLAVLARGMVEIGDYLKRLATICDAKVSSTVDRAVEWDSNKRGGNYPLPGWETFFHYNVHEIPGFDLATEYPHVKGYGAGGGARVFKIVHEHVKARPIDVRFEAAVQQLLTNRRREVVGVRVAVPDGERRIGARKAVILACGGFEANEKMKRQYWQMAPVLPVMARSNTGDGIRMAQELGADLWHMWHYHGSYGFRHPDPDYPYGVRMKRLPDWFPDESPSVRVPMAWIVVDRGGRRFMNENHPYTQDTNHRPMELFDTATQSFPRIPSYMICDEDGRKMYRLGMVTYNEHGLDYQWSEDNLAEVEMGYPAPRRIGGRARRRAGRGRRRPAGDRRSLERVLPTQPGRRFRAAARLDGADPHAPVLRRRGVAGGLEHAGRARAQRRSTDPRRQRAAHRAPLRGRGTRQRFRVSLHLGRQSDRMLHHRPDRRPPRRGAGAGGLIAPAESRGVSRLGSGSVRRRIFRPNAGSRRVGTRRLPRRPTGGGNRRRR